MIDRFADPWVFLLGAIPLIAWPLVRRRIRPPAMPLSLGARSGIVGSWRVRLAFVPGAVRWLCLALATTALARPQQLIGQTRHSTHGIAIQVVLDRSGSMNEPMAFDGQTVSRLDAVKKVLSQFVLGDGKDLKGRAADLIGLVTFARYADTACPLVHAHAALLDLAARTTVAANRAEDGTAIGDALALGAARLKQAEDDLARRGRSNARPDFVIKSKIIILLTDGVNNAGQVSPEEAGALAAEWGIKVYAVGIGAGESFQVIRTPFGDHRVPMGAEVDEDLLRGIAAATGGRYWRAGDAQALREVCAEIDRLEKTEVESLETTRARELFAYPAGAAGVALLAETVLAVLVFRRSP